MKIPSSWLCNVSSQQHTLISSTHWQFYKEFYQEIQGPALQSSLCTPVVWFPSVLMLSDWLLSQWSLPSHIYFLNHAALFCWDTQFAEGKMEMQYRAHVWAGTVGAWVSIFVLSYPFLPVLHLFFCCTLWFNIVLLPNFPLLLIVNSWQGLLGELILLQQQIQEHEEEARRTAGQYSTSYAQQKRKVMDGLRGLLMHLTNQSFLPRSCRLNLLMGSSHGKLFLTN